MKKSKVIIIGAGPSGIAAAVQLKRQGINPIIIEKNIPGGLILNANKIENYPGFPNGTTGTKLAKLLNKHLTQWNIVPFFDTVTNCEYVEETEKHFIIKSYDNQYRSDYLILATGTKPLKPKDIEIPFDCINFIHFEIYPILNVKNKDIAIIGAGDAAFDYALNLSSNNNVIIFNRTNKIKALDLLTNRVKQNNRIKYYPNYSLINLVKIDDKLNLFFKTDKKNVKIKFDYLIFAIGREPNLDYLEKSIQKNINKLISQKKLFLIGDLKNEKYRQLSIAVGDGVKTAMEIEYDLKHRNP